MNHKIAHKIVHRAFSAGLNAGDLKKAQAEADKQVDQAAIEIHNLIVEIVELLNQMGFDNLMTAHRGNAATLVAEILGGSTTA